MYENKILILSKLVNQLLMNSTESKIGLLGLEDAQTVLERGVKRGAVKMDVQLEIRWVDCAGLTVNVRSVERRDQKYRDRERERDRNNCLNFYPIWLQYYYGCETVILCKIYRLTQGRIIFLNERMKPPLLSIKICRFSFKGFQ